MNTSYLLFWIIVITHNLLIHYTAFCLYFYPKNSYPFIVFSFIFYNVTLFNFMFNGCPLIRYERKLLSKNDSLKYLGPLTPIFYLYNYLFNKNKLVIINFKDTNIILSKTFFIFTFGYVITKIII